MDAAENTPTCVDTYTRVHRSRETTPPDGLLLQTCPADFSFRGIVASVLWLRDARGAERQRHLRLRSDLGGWYHIHREALGRGTTVAAERITQNLVNDVRIKAVDECLLVEPKQGLA